MWVVFWRSGAPILEEDSYNSYFKLWFLSPFKTVPFQRMSASRVNCLLVLSSSSEGYTADLFRFLITAQNIFHIVTTQNDKYIGKCFPCSGNAPFSQVLVWLLQLGQTLFKHVAGSNIWHPKTKKYRRSHYYSNSKEIWEHHSF